MFQRPLVFTYLILIFSLFTQLGCGKKEDQSETKYGTGRIKFSGVRQ